MILLVFVCLSRMSKSKKTEGFLTVDEIQEIRDICVRRGRIFAVDYCGQQSAAGVY